MNVFGECFSGRCFRFLNKQLSLSVWLISLYRSSSSELVFIAILGFVKLKNSTEQYMRSLLCVRTVLLVTNWIANDVDQRNSNQASQISNNKEKKTHSYLGLKPRKACHEYWLFFSPLSDQLVCLTHSPMLNLSCIPFKFNENLSHVNFNSIDIHSLESDSNN